MYPGKKTGGLDLLVNNYNYNKEIKPEKKSFLLLKILVRKLELMLLTIGKRIS